MATYSHNRPSQANDTENHIEYYQNQPESSDNYDSQNSFSFNKQFKKPDQPQQNRYHELYDDLKSMELQDVIQLLLEEIQENQEIQMMIKSMKNKVIAYEEEASSMKEALKKKSEAIALLCQTQSKNLQLIEKLELKLSKKKDYMKDTHYQKKYQQLSIYMNEYIRSINQTQEQFKIVYSFLKNQNQRLEKQLERAHLQSIKNDKKHQLQSQQVKRLQLELGQLFDKNKNLEHHYYLTKQQNEILRKEIEIYQENIRITDRLQIPECHENQQLSSELDFIRDKIMENEHFGKDIIEKLEESSLNYEKIVKVREQLNDSLVKERKKIGELQNEIGVLRAKLQKMESEKNAIQSENSKIKKQKQQRDSLYLQTKSQKQLLQRQLRSMTKKLQQLESTHHQEIQKNEKIKQQLSRFLQNNNKNQYHVLSEVKANDSQSTFSYTETQQNNHSCEIMLKSRSFKKISVDNSNSQDQRNKDDKENVGNKSEKVV